MDDGEVVEQDDVIEDTEENEKGDGVKKVVKKEAKKPVRNNKQSKLSVATVGDKNNTSLLNFFQKSSQKRTLATANSSFDIISHFLASRKLKICKNF